MIMALEEYLRTLSSRFNTCIIKALKSLTRMHPKKKKKSMTRLQFCLSLSCLQTFNSSSPNSMGEILFKYLLPLHLDHPGVGVPFKSLFFINVTITVSKEHLTWK